MANVNRLLLVEDNSDIRESLGLIFSTSGYQVTECANGATAIEEAIRALPAVAIIDVGLPDIDGFKVAAKIRQIEKRRQVPNPAILVALTGRDPAPTRRESSSSGFDLHYTKPVEPTALVEEIELIKSGRLDDAVKIRGGSEKKSRWRRRF